MITQKSQKEQLNIAKNTSCEKILYSLHDSQYMNVRRVVARNSNITTIIANRLAVDPVLNVSYMAIQNKKCTSKRDFSHLTLPDCVMCEKDEQSLDCVVCENKNKTLLNN